MHLAFLPFKGKNVLAETVLCFTATLIKNHRCSSYFQLSSRCLSVWSNPVFRVWCIVRNKIKAEKGMKLPCWYDPGYDRSLHFPVTFHHGPFVSWTRDIVKSSSLPYKAVTVFIAYFEIFSERYYLRWFSDDVRLIVLDVVIVFIILVFLPSIVSQAWREQHRVFTWLPLLHHHTPAQPALPAGNLGQGDTSELHDHPPGAGGSAVGNCGREGETWAGRKEEPAYIGKCCK